jgi:uncharacterized membrane protein SpoIIM required for sporulation
MIRSLRRFTKSFDIFGKPISLKFDKKWNTHDTKFGGFSTVLLILFIIIYSSVCINVMVTYGQDSIRNIYQEIKLKELGNVKYNETKVLFLAWLNSRIIDIHADISHVFQYVDIYFEQ